MNILVNERPCAVPEGSTMAAICRRYTPAADVLICNGAVAPRETEVHEGDCVTLIVRGSVPDADEFEAQMMARHTPGVHAVLKASCVGIAGLGGLGSTVAIALARIGVGRLVLVDFDVVEPSNLNRQQYFIDQIGMAKPDALVHTLQRINPYIKYEPVSTKLIADNVSTLFRDVQVLVEAFDRADQKAMLAAAFKGAFPDRPLIMASGLAGCGEENTIRVHRPGRQWYVVGDLESAAQPGTGLMAPRVGIAAHMQANLAVRLLLNGGTELEHPEIPI